MSAELQDAVTLANDAEIATAIRITTTELEHVQALIRLRGRNDRLTTDELEVLARLADLQRQAQQ